MWGDPSISDWEQAIHPLTPEEAALIPTGNWRMRVTTYADNTQELVDNMYPTFLSERFRRCMRVWYRRVVDPEAAIPFLMGGHLRLGADSPVQSLDPEILRLIVQHTVVQRALN